MSSSSNNPKPSIVTGFPAAPTNGHDPSIPAAAAPSNGHDPSIPAAATGYPYCPTNPNPNPYYYPNNPNPNPYYYHRPNPNPNRNIFLRRLVIITIAAFIAVGAVTFIIYLVLRPQFPIFTLTSLSVSSLNVTSTDSLSSSFSITFSVQNPNSKLTVSYDDVTAQLLSFSGDPFTSTRLPPFSQSKHNVTAIAAKMAVVDAFVGPDAVRRIRAGNGLNLDAKLLTMARFWSGAWRMRRYELEVLCRDVRIALRNGSSTEGSMTDGPRRCTFGAWRI